MSSTSRAWVVAASMGMVEALKDQGFCRWNHTIRSLHQHAKANLGSLSQAQRLPSSVDRRRLEGNEQARQYVRISKILT
ncbi:hypothetical protein Taro_018816 [Colocasia esculenta]|uniref:Wound-responsive family protein n=1 Tax=Colocasia esculenta TaxID=4460 RepID=A0A843UUR6_COLES|nr:hypothetical protein [Colocasia esculenta]